MTSPSIRPVGDQSRNVSEKIDAFAVPPTMLERVIVVGTSGVGKTAFARRLSRALQIPHIELDDLFWGPDWTPKTESEFRRLVDLSTRENRWIADGNYGVVRDILWPRATGVIWLNYGFFTALLRALHRSIGRIVHRIELFSGNRESFARTFLSRRSILVWIVTTHHRRRRDYNTLRSSDRFPQLQWLEFRRSSNADAFLEAAGRTRSPPRGG